VPRSPQWHQLLGARALWVVVKLVSLTIRHRVNDPHGFMTCKDIRQVIYCTWHNRLALSMKLHSVLGFRQHPAAGLAGLPAVPVSYHVNWKVRLKSWDRFQIPMPFSRCEITIGRTLSVPRESSDASRKLLRQQLETEMRAITRDNRG
jgi:lysophospholipid acyltransferase (LPLAT)-like uncharacterized protein